MSVTAGVTGAFKRALVDACQTATAGMVLPDHDLLVRYGRPSSAQVAAFDEIIGVTRIDGSIDPATMTASKRTREMALTAEIVFSVFRSGPSDYLDEDAEQEAGDRAYALFGAVEEHIRVNDITLGDLGGVRWCLCVDHTSDGESSPEVLAKGRSIEITTSWLAMARLTA